MLTTVRVHGFFLSYMGHDIYYYSFGASEAFRQKDTHKEGAAVVTFNNEDLDPEIRNSFAVWTTKPQ